MKLPNPDIYQSLEQINDLLAEAAEELRNRWEDLPVDTRQADIGAWVEQNMPHIEALTDQRRAAKQPQTFASIDDLADRLGWRDVERQHAIDSLQDDKDAYGDECVITAHSGRELRTPAYPREVDYMRITQHGFEIMYWSKDEWIEDPEVIGAVIGCLKNGRDAPESEDLTCTFDLGRVHERQGGLL